MKFYNHVNPKLENYISHYWTTAGVLDAEKSYKILPMNHIDLIMPITGAYYHMPKAGVLEDTTQIFFRGMRDQSIEVVRHGYVECIGISFKPWGFYPFIRKGLSQYQNKLVDLKLENVTLANELVTITRRIDSVKDVVKIEAIIAEIETALLRSLEVESYDYEETQQLLMDLCNSEGDDMEVLIKPYPIAVRTLERMFNKFIGTNPRTFYKIKQFEEASRAVLYDGQSSLTHIAYDANYYDQAHFSKAFKKFTSDTPKRVRQNKTVLKSHMIFE
ncbi:helix-turn-helix domain-containing protein [Fusibacter ferrireducens]|uniref:AraC family transcriptional regulator n=1 Tax=Fusibacter ferrireducens TaxID=2785058 RepID=A0ABR9ZM39_9FIRM|nr:helix-turn-helix domain-containing protein [Fusibacter ferrireducens]MBF4691538.1 AraC family transcriptional regulator [Fusibacter ferrireducens]